MAFFLHSTLLVALVTFVASEDSVLTERVLRISDESALLSALAYRNATNYAVFDANGNVTGFEHPDYDFIDFFTDEPDQAVMAKKDGRCYFAFRGTSASLADWEQNINLGKVSVHQDNDETLQSCQARAGYTDFLQSEAVAPAYQDIIDCVDTCSDLDDCLVITGHSQGGAAATVLSILVYSLKPQVVTFGQPPALDGGCTLVPSERFYRFVNHRQEDREDNDLGFDPVPFSPTLISNAKHYGHYLLVGDDPNNAKYLGFDQNYTFVPDFRDRQNEIEAHTLNGTDYSYSARVKNLLASGSFPVSTDGFANGIICERQYGELCASGSCRDNACVDKLTELCIPGSCDEDNDCETNACIADACATANGEVEPGCPCGRNRNCLSGDCDTSFLQFDWICTNLDGTTPPAKNVPNNTSAAEHLVCTKSLSVGAAMLGMALFSWM